MVPLSQSVDSTLADVTSALAEYAAENDRTGDFPTKGIQIVHDAGLLTSTVAPRNAGLADTVRVLTALGQGDPAVALITAMTLFAHVGARTWPTDVTAPILAESAARPTLINALRVEPELGTPARGGLPATTAYRRGDAWEITGHKIFSTGAPGLRWLLVYATVAGTAPASAATFLIRADAPGITIDRTWNHLGLRASRSDDVHLDRVPAIGPLPEGPTGLRDWNALGIGAIYLGVARAATDWLLGYLNERTPTNLGTPLASLPRFQQETGEIMLALLSASTLLDSLAADADRGLPIDAGLGKTFATRAAIDAVQRAAALVGNAALTRHHPLERHLRDVLCGRIHTPQDDVVLTAAGRAALDGAPSKGTT